MPPPTATAGGSPPSRARPSPTRAPTSATKGFLGVFSGVRGRGILRSSPKRNWCTGAPPLLGRNRVSRSLDGEVELARDLYAPPYRACHRAAGCVNLEYPLYLLAIPFVLSGEVKGLLDPLDHQYLACGFYLPLRLGV